MRRKRGEKKRKNRKKSEKHLPKLKLPNNKRKNSHIDAFDKHF
jgi:hypothetical protein